MEYIDNLFTIKTKPPRIGIETIWRQRLLESFEGYEYKKLSIVSAPTGYGKTVLISQFAMKVKYPVVWYQLDGFDNDLTTFIRCFIKGISRKIKHFGLQTLDFIDEHKDVSKQIHLIAVILANELEARAKEGLVFIFDDYHLIHEKTINTFIAELIEYIPKGVHLVISSRYVLPFNIARLKSHGLVNEITYNPLKFSRYEIRQFFEFNKSRSISEDIIEKVQLETGGWAVALSLIKTSLFKMEEGKRNLALNKWRNREEVYNYFAEEVFYQLPKVLQEFLINTSILDVMTPNICNELIERKDSKEILDNLMKQNIFLMKIEGEEDTYRYHHLFRDFLQQRLGNKKTILLENAGQYYLKNGHIEQAVYYYIAAGLYEQAVIAVEKIGIKMLKSGNWQTINYWIEKIPREFVRKSPWLMMLKGVIYSYKGMRNEALMQIDRALEMFLSCGNKEGALKARIQKSSVLRRAGQLDESLILLNEILPVVGELPILEWYDVILEKVNILLWKGCLNEAIETLKQGIEFAEHDEEHRLTAYFMEHLGATYYATGDYYKAIEFYEDSKERYLQVYNPLSEVEKERYSQRTTLARIYRDWGELEKALELIEEEINIKERLGFIDDLPRAYHQLALIHNDLGKKSDAEKYFKQVDEMYRKLDRKDFQWTWHVALYGKILMDNGKQEKGRALIKKAIERAKGKSDFNLAVCEFVGCSVYIDSGQIREGIKILEHALQVGKKVGAKNLICQCYWNLSNIYLITGNIEKAKNYAIHCFTLAREGNYLQIFLSYKTNSLPTIKLAIEMGIEEQFIEKIILKLGSKSEEMLLELIKSNQLDIKHRAKQLLLKIRNKEDVTNKEDFTEDKNQIVQENCLIKVRCFGNFEVFGKDYIESVEWKTSKAKEVFAYLVNNINKTVSKEKILEDIWPGMNPNQTSKWLHTYVYQIRRIMKNFGIEKGLIYKNKGYCLESKGIESDVDKFKKLINNSQIKEIDKQIKNLEEGILLYRGEYLEEYDNNWVMEEKHGLEQVYLRALERLSKLYIENEEYKLAIECLHKMLKNNPLLEKSHETLMIIYEKTGDRIAAINQYEVFYKTLKTELGIEPKKEIKDLYNRLIKENNDKKK